MDAARAAAARVRDRRRRLMLRVAPGRARRSAFQSIYGDGGWPSLEGEGSTKSGTGSGLEQTAAVRAELPGLLRDLGARSLLDAPCGDFFWMQHCPIEVDEYIGMDIVPELIARNVQAFEATGRRFEVGDIVTDPLPEVDVILCRDCLVHLPFQDVSSALRNLAASGSTYLLTTTFPEHETNRDLDRAGKWRPLNLQAPPFALPAPLRLLKEQCTEDGGLYTDKSLALWKLADLVG
jgi:hypothetical protein